MDLHESNRLISQAHQLLQTAENETNRAIEDKVSFLICTNARRSIQSYLQGFLTSNGYEGNLDLNIQDLLHQCTIYDPTFLEIRFKDMLCATHKDANEFCLDDDRAHSCLQTARIVRHHIMHNTSL